MALSEEVSKAPGFLSSASRMPSQMVGTPAVKVTFSEATRPSSEAGSRCGPGKTCLVPVITAVKGSPQALTWNMGTTGIITSDWLSPSESGSAEASEWSTTARWE